MCLAVYKPAGAWASKEQLRNSYEANPHGAGYAYHDGTQVHIVKGFFSWRSFWKSYKRHVTSAMPALAHFRIATRGEKDMANCHPFNIGNGALMHNGPCINHRHCNGDKERSDTRQFAEDFITGLASTQVKRIQPMIEHFIGTEKIVLLFDDGEVILCNEKEGQWADGCWWSNSSFRGYGTRSFATSHNTRADDPDDHWDWWDKARAQHKAEAAAKTAFTAADSKWRLTYSLKLKGFIPKEGMDHDGIPCVWNEELSAYIDTEWKDCKDLKADDDYVYDMSTTKQLVVGYVLRTVSQVGWFLGDEFLDVEEESAELESADVQGALALLTSDNVVTTH
jgi:glutamine amidotransferase